MSLIDLYRCCITNILKSCMWYIQACPFTRAVLQFIMLIMELIQSSVKQYCWGPLKLSDIQITSRLTLECSSLETDFCWKYSNFSVDFSSSSVGFLKNHFKADFRLFLLCNRIFFIYSSEIIWIFGGKYSIFVCEIFSFFSGKFYQITSSFTLSCFPIERKQLFSFFLSRKLK